MRPLLRTAILLTIAVAVCTSCTTQEERLIRHLVRAAEAEPVAVAVMLPDRLVQAAGYDTTVEITLEPRDLPVELSRFERDFAQELFEGLRTRNGPIKLAGFEAGSPYIEALDKDPRREGKPGYKLLPEFVTKPPRKKGEYPTRAEIARIKSLTVPNDKHPNRYLLAVDGPYANGTRRHYLSLDFDAVKTATGAEYLLLFSVDGIQTVKNGGTTVAYSSGLISLTEGVLVFYEHGEYETAAPSDGAYTAKFFDGMTKRWMDQVAEKLGLPDPSGD